MKIKIPEITAEFIGRTYGGDEVVVSIRMEGGKGVRPAVIYRVGDDPFSAVVDMFGEMALYGESRTKLNKIKSELHSIYELTIQQ